MRFKKIQEVTKCCMCWGFAEYIAEETNEPLCKYCNTINNLIRTNKGKIAVFNRFI